MRALYLRAIPVGGLLLLLAIPVFVTLVLLSVFSERAQEAFEKMFGGSLET